MAPLKGRESERVRERKRQRERERTGRDRERKGRYSVMHTVTVLETIDRNIVKTIHFRRDLNSRPKDPQQLKPVLKLMKQ